MSTHSELEELERAIDTAEQKKREFVRDNPGGSGDSKERARLYAEVERARKALREYKIRNQLT